MKKEEREAKQKAKAAMNFASVQNARKNNGLPPLVFGKAPENVIVEPSQREQKALSKKLKCKKCGTNKLEFSATGYKCPKCGYESTQEDMK
jgi:hypothetical protein